MGKDGHPRFSSESNSMSAEIHTVSQKALKLDTIVEALNLKPTFIKIDVEGAEFEVLLGMQETLSQYHPTLMLEIHPQWQPSGASVDKIYQIMTHHGYSSQNITHDPISDRTLWQVV